MHIAIFGASGATGRLLTDHSLEAGHTVTALVRSPASFPFRDRVTVVQGNAFDPAAVALTVDGAQVVFSALGAKSPLRNENVLPRAVPLIIEAMRHAGVRRIIVLGAAGARPDALRNQPAWRRWVIQSLIFNTVLKWPIHDQIVQLNLLSASGLDWTMVLPPRLTNGPAHGICRIDADALPRLGSSISRSDVADFMFQQIANSEWIGKSVYLSD
ncbi:NAD(P)-dependent oxidoreductase [Edaphobacter aggregans]|uniref:NAD(P)-dependent oxidoreductase n=1 Tax=Edaphobacter aggregans TaxID=570835 RepID=UPI00068C9B8C|nr:SDR family oxidoreductase [Edaphobacter aggregans]